MSPFDLGSADSSPMIPDRPATSDQPASSLLSPSQVASLISTVSQALARGQSVAVVSEGRMLARYLPPRAGAGEAGGTDGAQSRDAEPRG